MKRERRRDFDSLRLSRLCASYGIEELRDEDLSFSSLDLHLFSPTAFTTLRRLPLLYANAGGEDHFRNEVTLKVLPRAIIYSTRKPIALRLADHTTYEKDQSIFKASKKARERDSIPGLEVKVRNSEALAAKTGNIATLWERRGQECPMVEPASKLMREGNTLEEVTFNLADAEVVQNKQHKSICVKIMLGDRRLE